MTPRKSHRVSVSMARYADYRKVADNFFMGAEAAKTFEYWNAAGVLIVHSAIAYADSLTIKVGGVKSHGEDHMAAVDLVGQVVALDERGEKALIQLSRLIEQKNLVSYSGEIYSRKDVDDLWKYLERFRAWILPMLAD